MKREIPNIKKSPQAIPERMRRREPYEVIISNALAISRREGGWPAMRKSGYLPSDYQGLEEEVTAHLKENYIDKTWQELETELNECRIRFLEKYNLDITDTSHLDPDDMKLESDRREIVASIFDIAELTLFRYALAGDLLSCYLLVIIGRQDVNSKDL